MPCLRPYRPSNVLDPSLDPSTATCQRDLSCAVTSKRNFCAHTCLRTHTYTYTRLHSSGQKLIGPRRTFISRRFVFNKLHLPEYIPAGKHRVSCGHRYSQRSNLAVWHRCSQHTFYSINRHYMEVIGSGHYHSSLPRAHSSLPIALFSTSLRVAAGVFPRP